MAPPTRKSATPTKKPQAVAPAVPVVVPEKPDPYAMFLRQLAAMPIKGDALKGTGLTAQDVRARSEMDADFAREMSKAWELGVDVLEDAAIRRGVLGWEEPVFTKDGGLSGYVTRYDGSLLKEVLKANSAKYRGEDAGRSRGVAEETRREVLRIFDEAQDLP